MEYRKDRILDNIDWTTILLYGVLVILGWFNIYAAVYNPEVSSSMFDFSTNSGKQLIWILTCIIWISAIMIVDFKFYDTFAYFVYGFLILMLIAVLLFGKEVAGSRSWFEIGSIRLQPAEFAKFAAVLALARFMSLKNVKFTKLRDLLSLFGIILTPAILIILQGDTGSALVYAALILVLYREGLSPVILIIGVVSIAIFVLTLVYPKMNIIIGIFAIALTVSYFFRRKIKNIILIFLVAIIASGVVFGVDFFVTEVLKPHQQNRIKALINPGADPLGYGWNVTQSQIAIGSGGFQGRGFLKGMQTKFDFVPEQSTDFIFCTIGEEHGFLGSVFVIALFVALLIRIIIVAERQKEKFSRIYGYGVASIFFFHFAINIGMTIGLAPVVGIPLPFFSYGGSSLWSFTILLFILLKLDAHRTQVLSR